jgi:hypothetical protein
MGKLIIENNRACQASVPLTKKRTRLLVIARNHGARIIHILFVYLSPLRPMFDLNGPPYLDGRRAGGESV